MHTSQAEVHPTANKVYFTDSELKILLRDGRIISVPIAWFSRLSKASKEQLEDFKLLGNGDGIHWPQLDEDLSVKRLLVGFH